MQDGPSLGSTDGVMMSRRAPGARLRGAAASWRWGAVLTCLLLVGCSGDDLRDGDGRVVEAGEASVFELQVGDCLDPGNDVSGEIADVLVVPCEEPHTQELYAILNHPDDTYPGATEVAAYADGACLNELEDTLGFTLDDGLYFSYLLPTFDGWNTGGDRQILCVLVFPDREAVTGSFVDGTADLDRLPPDPPQEPDDDLEEPGEVPSDDEDGTDPSVDAAGTDRGDA